MLLPTTKQSAAAALVSAQLAVELVRQFDILSIKTNFRIHGARMSFSPPCDLDFVTSSAKSY